MAYVKKVKKPRQSIEKSLAIIKGTSGDEPIMSKEKYKESLLGALNWYNFNWDEKDYRKSAEYYVGKHLKMKDAVGPVSRAPFQDIRIIGVVGRLVVREQYVDLDTLERALTRLEEVKVKYAKKPVVVKDDKPKAPVPNIQDRIRDTARDLAGEVDGAIDDYLGNGTEFSMKSFLVSNQVSGVVAKKIGTFYEPLLAEIEEAIAGTCPQLKEGYSRYTKRGLKQYAQFIQSIIDDCNQQVVSAKAQRKPRARKVIPASVVVKKLAYKKEDPVLKLKSVPADKIVGATELWAYNTETRKMTVFYAADGGYLTVNRMSIANYDVAKSQTKTLRKPEDFFKGLSSTGKRAMANAWKDVKSKALEPKARLNMDVILFAVN
jgi:hypothetical protein